MNWLPPPPPPLPLIIATVPWQVRGGVKAGVGLPSNPSEITRDGNQPSRVPLSMRQATQDWAGAPSGPAQNKYSHARGNYADLDDFTDWRFVRLPAQRKGKQAILSAQGNIMPNGRPAREKFRPGPVLRPSNEVQKQALQRKMACGGKRNDIIAMGGPPTGPNKQPLPAQPPPSQDAVDEFAGVMAQIEERRQWMTEMKQLGALDPEKEAAVKAQISAKLGEARTLDSKLSRKPAGKRHPPR